MAVEATGTPITCLDELQSIPLFATVRLQLPDGTYLCCGSGGVVTSEISASCASELLLCCKPGADGNAMVCCFLTRSSKAALVVQKGWLSNGLAFMPRMKQPLQNFDFFNIRPCCSIDHVPTGEDSDDASAASSPSGMWTLAQGNQFVSRSNGLFTTTSVQNDALQLRLHWLEDQSWPFSLQPLRCRLTFDPSEGRSDEEKEWNSKVVTETFTIIEGMRQTETLYFLAHSTLTRLRKVVVTYKLGVQVDSQTIMLGDYPAASTPYSFTFPRIDVPVGYFVQGWFSQTVSWISDEGPAFPSTENTFQIVANCKSSHPTSQLSCPLDNPLTECAPQQEPNEEDTASPVLGSGRGSSPVFLECS